MQKLVILFFFLFIINKTHSQQSANMDLLAHWNDTSLPIVDGDQLWSDLGGYYDSIHTKEYAILLGNDSLYFFDVSIPTATKLVATYNGFSTKSINRDVEVYSHYAYFVSERSGTLGGLQIIDLQYLPDSVHEVYRSDALSVQAHTIYVEAASKRLYVCQNSLKMGFSALDILSIENPEVPVKLASLQVPMNSEGMPQFTKVHEMYNRNDTVYLSCYESGLYIMDLTNLNNQKLISVISNYPQRGTNHSSWLNTKGNMIMFTDENQGSPIKIFDLTDITNPKQMVYFNSHPNALPHNAYWKDNAAIVSSYEDGVYVYDLTNPINPKVHAFYDTYPLNSDGVYSGFHGCWGVWPFLPSGIILASDISEGLFVMKLKYDVGSPENKVPLVNKITIFPNPTSNILNFSFENLENNLEVKLFDIQGKLVATKILDLENKSLDISALDCGMYLCNLSNGSFSKTYKISKN